MVQGEGKGEIGDVYLRTHHHHKNSATCCHGEQETGSKAVTTNASVNHVGALLQLSVAACVPVSTVSAYLCTRVRSHFTVISYSRDKPRSGDADTNGLYNSVYEFIISCGSTSY